MNQPYTTLGAKALCKLFGVPLYKESARALVSKSDCTFMYNNSVELVICELNNCDTLCNCISFSLDGLVMRFEAPQSRNRWDSPLFTILPEDELPCEAICDALFHRKAPPPNMSTVSVGWSNSFHLHHLHAYYTMQSIKGHLVISLKISSPSINIRTS